MEDARPEQWALFVTRFSGFRTESSSGRLEFQGEGDEEPSPSWQRAVSAWAQALAGELWLGSNGAWRATALRWSEELPERPGFCESLRVESYGYAYSGLANCASNETAVLSQGWLTDDELLVLDRWLYQKTKADLPDLNFSGFGSQSMSEEEVNALRDWANAVYARQTGKAANHATAPGATSPGRACTIGPGQNPCSTTVEYQDARGVTQSELVNFLLYLPRGYRAGTSQKWPLILFLHGSEERGKDPRVLTRQGLPKMLATESDFPFMVASPQCPSGEWWWPRTRILSAFLDWIESEHAVDSQRIYVTGLSMGGFGAWALAYQYPERFAAVVPIAGGYFDGTSALPGDICKMAQVPIWAFHGALDRQVLVGESQRVVDALRACGSGVRFTLYPDAGHIEAWEQAYADAELFDWLLQQRLP